MARTVTIRTRKCIMCGEGGEITVDAERWAEYIKEYNDPSSQSPKRHIQGAFPEMSADDREQIVSGTHAKCWNKMLGLEG